MTERIQSLREMFFAATHKAFRTEDSGESILNETTRGLPFCIRKAMAFRRATEIMPIFVQDGELIVGGKTLYTLPSYITDEEIRDGNHNFETKGYNNLFDNGYNLGQDERGYGIINSSIPAYYKIVPMGLPAIVADAKARMSKTSDPEKISYYRSVIIANEAAIEFIARYEALLRTRAEDTKDEARKSELSLMANGLHALQVGAPQNYLQAVQLMYFIQFLIWTEGGFLIPLGRCDQLLYPYYEKDVGSGALTKDMAFEILECFFLKLNQEIDRTHGEKGKFESDTGQSITIGGIDRLTGADATNELTYMILDAKCDTHVTDPKVHLRVHSGTPEAVWKKAAYLNSLGMGFPTYENDDSMIPAFMSHDCYSLEDARDYAASGCWEMVIEGRSFNRNLGMIDCLRCLEWALGNGESFLAHEKKNGALGLLDGRYGINTGAPVQLDSYKKLFNAFKVQMKHNIDSCSSYCNRGFLSPSPFYSSMMEDCLENGCDFDGGGVRYTETDFQLSSLSNAADALYAIKTLVYDEKKLTLAQLVEILKNDWAGAEELRLYIINKLPKFGNDVDEVDLIAKDIVNYYTREVSAQVNSFGGPYRARISSALGYVGIAQSLGASADGRHARDLYSDNLSPALGADKNGPTAIVKSCGKLPYGNCAGGAMLDMKFHPSSLKTEEGREKFSSIIKTYFALGGLQTQINVLDNKVLLDAKAHPENYRDLIVRVWGFSTYFVSLPEAYQDHIIARSTLM